MSPRTRVTVMAILVLLLLAGSAVYVQAFYRQKPLQEVQTDKKIVALTFDISWGYETPPAVLKVLKDHQVQCTFFLSGPWVTQYPEIARQIKDDGHEIASHGYRHINLTNFSKSEIKAELMKAHQAITAVTGESPRLFRAPNGDYNNNVIKAVYECNYRAIRWGTDSLDWMNPGISIIVDRINKHIHPGDIILMHASDTSKQTAQALPTIIENIHSQGYEILTVSELLAEAAANP
ncbi:MAG: polysaccharide deacetylase family sporulation protein PdaB [Syntrophomonadaceae bacterium]|nr:polysaccharide deacetylase family sporulation protein PdaB [Syntrophomonadaceae bacterium]